MEAKPPGPSMGAMCRSASEVMFQALLEKTFGPKSAGQGQQAEVSPGYAAERSPGDPVAPVPKEGHAPIHTRLLEPFNRLVQGKHVWTEADIYRAKAMGSVGMMHLAGAHPPHPGIIDPYVIGMGREGLLPDITQSGHNLNDAAGQRPAKAGKAGAGGGGVRAGGRVSSVGSKAAKSSPTDSPAVSGQPTSNTGSGRSGTSGMSSGTLDGLDSHDTKSKESLFDDDDEEIDGDDKDPDVKRVKRMLSNRESARRSRRRKQAHLSELEVQVGQLRMENGALLKKISEIGQHYAAAMEDNAGLRATLESFTHQMRMHMEAHLSEQQAHLPPGHPGHPHPVLHGAVLPGEHDLIPKVVVPPGGMYHDHSHGHGHEVRGGQFYGSAVPVPAMLEDLEAGAAQAVAAAMATGPQAACATRHGSGSHAGESSPPRAGSPGAAGAGEGDSHPAAAKRQRRSVDGSGSSHDYVPAASHALFLEAREP